MLTDMHFMPLPNDLGAFRPIFDQQAWERYYSQEDYKNKTEQVRQFTLHFLLILEKDEKALLKSIQSFKIEKLTLPDPHRFNLTPFHIAVMRANKLASEAIFSRIKEAGKASQALEAEDAFSWRPLHHACLSSEELFKWLLTLGAHKTAKTKSEATIETLQILTGRVRPAKTLNHLDLQVPMDASLPFEKKLEQISGIAFYTDHPIYSPEFYKKLWTKLPPPNRDKFDDWVHSGFKMLYSQWKNNPPQLIVRECPRLKNKTPFSFELAAAKAIKRGRIVGSYPGLIRELPPPSKAFADRFKAPFSEDRFSLGEYEAAKAASAIRFANSGWPNTAMIKIDPVEGCSQNILLAFEDIPPGAPIVWDYSFDSIILAYSDHVLFDREKIRDYFAQGLKPRIQEMTGYHQNIAQEFVLYGDKLNIHAIIELYALQSRLIYPLANPKALLDLHFLDKVHAKQWLDMLLKPTLQIIIDISKKMAGAIWTLKSVLKRILEFDKAFEQNSPAKKIAKKWILKAIDDLTIMQILKGMQLASLDPTKILEKGETAFEEMNLKSYDWLKDENAPLSFARRRQDIYDEYASKNEPKEKIAADLQTNLDQMKLHGIDPESESYLICEWLLSNFKTH